MSILFSGDFHASLAGEIATIANKSLIKKYGNEKYNDIKSELKRGYQYLYRTTKILGMQDSMMTVYNEYNKADR